MTLRPTLIENHGIATRAGFPASWTAPGKAASTTVTIDSTKNKESAKAQQLMSYSRKINETDHAHRWKPGISVPEER
jgi:hypothetical protein